MRRTLHVPEGWREKKFLLHFEALWGHCHIYIDGIKVGEHFGNSLPHTYPLDDFVTPERIMNYGWVSALRNFSM